MPRISVSFPWLSTKGATCASTQERQPSGWSLIPLVSWGVARRGADAHLAQSQWDWSAPRFSLSLSAFRWGRCVAGRFLPDLIDRVVVRRVGIDVRAELILLGGHESHCSSSSRVRRARTSRDRVAACALLKCAIVCYLGM
jgi:hypothetical protein